MTCGWVCVKTKLLANFGHGGSKFQRHQNWGITGLIAKRFLFQEGLAVVNRILLTTSDYGIKSEIICQSDHAFKFVIGCEAHLSIEISWPSFILPIPVCTFLTFDSQSEVSSSAKHNEFEHYEAHNGQHYIVCIMYTCNIGFRWDWCMCLIVGFASSSSLASDQCVINMHFTGPVNFMKKVSIFKLMHTMQTGPKSDCNISAELTTMVSVPKNADYSEAWAYQVTTISSGVLRL